ncbi:hypothetical protein AAFF_G00307450 [Aldrovandia affinis]|uniref:SEA domain-containing protein n=1 Tax=Aldrovandia affinis TaxID=143900 RepID=A0AAD7R7V0_9TELE|nr:hypothetical protein AAFF_G00307450 [Aldrovandia affinis]
MPHQSASHAIEQYWNKTYLHIILFCRLHLREDEYALEDGDLCGVCPGDYIHKCTNYNFSSSLYKCNCSSSLYKCNCSSSLYKCNCSSSLYKCNCSSSLYKCNCSSSLYKCNCSSSLYNSPLFSSRVMDTVTQIQPIYETAFDNFIRVDVLRFRSGSIITETAIVFNSSGSIPNNTQVARTLIQAVENGNVTLPINTSSIVVSTVPSNATMTPAPTPATTTPGPTSATTTPATTPAIVVIAVITVPPTTAPPPGSTVSLLLQFSSDETFSPDLSNSNSLAFRNRAELIRSELTPVFIVFSSFRDLIITSFRSGSIVNIGNLTFNSAGSIPDTAEVTLALVRAVESGNLTIPINASSISVTNPSSSGVSPVHPSVFSCTLLTLGSLLLAAMLNFS